MVEKKMRHHGNAPSNRCEVRAFYRILTPLGLSARYGYTTVLRASIEYVGMDHLHELVVVPVVHRDIDDRGALQRQGSLQRGRDLLGLVDPQPVRAEGLGNWLGTSSKGGLQHVIRRLRRVQRGGTADRTAAADGDEILSSERLLPRWQALSQICM